MKRSLLLAILVVVALPYGFSATGSMAQDTEKKKPKTLTVKSAPIKIYEEVKGTVESKAMTEVKTDTKSWSELKVKDVVAQGAKVSQGDKLVAFETEKIDRKIAESKYALDLATLAFNQAKLAHEQFLATYEMDVEMAERAWKDAKDDHDYFMNVTMPQSKKAAEFSLKTTLWDVENSREELEQLEKMYKEDELTEESELIVLKRAQRRLERNEFRLDSAKVSTKQQVDVTIPRQVVSAKDSHRRAELTYEKQKITLPMMRKQKEIELEKARFALEKQKRDFEKLTADREKMVLASPASGTLYYGKCSRGAWAGVSGGATRKLNVGTVVPAKKVIMTIVDLAQLQLRCDLTESQLAGVKKGKSGKATSAAYPDADWTATVENVDMIPMTGGKFDCVMSLAGSGAQLMPGMTCKVKILTYENKNGIKVPSKAVFSDDDGESHYVFMASEGGKVRRTVQTGKKIGESTEITSGLVNGESILLSKPE